MNGYLIPSIPVLYPICNIPECDLSQDLSNTAGATCGAGNAYPFGAPELTPSFLVGSVLLSLQLQCCVSLIVVGLFVFFLFHYIKKF